VTSAELLTDGFGRVQEVVHEAVDGLSAAQLAVRLDEDANSIGWLCWHLARVQDDHVADAFGVEQVWPAFMDRFGLPFEPGAIGYGHSSAEVALVRISSANLLTAYHDAVHAQTVALVSGVTDADLPRVVDERWRWAQRRAREADSPTVRQWSAKPRWPAAAASVTIA
jgi:hypothetical protein